ncbi:hypothetical protein F4861DRAFT_545608 [Xylaria intraflava]|nr:hypothetical protein F4861DRAFT_545608 [Xylaria intraflava]
MKERIEKLQDREDRWEQWYKHDEASEHKRPSDENHKDLEDYKTQVAYNETVVECLERVKEKGERVSHQAFPPFEVSTTQPWYIKDWALIALDSSKFLTNPEIKVYVADCPIPGLLGFENEEFLSLKWHKDEVANSMGIKVAKRGMKTGLTHGITNGIEAAIRCYSQPPLSHSTGRIARLAGCN